MMRDLLRARDRINAIGPRSFRQQSDLRDIEPERIGVGWPRQSGPVSATRNIAARCLKSAGREVGAVGIDVEIDDLDAGLRR